MRCLLDIARPALHAHNVRCVLSRLLPGVLQDAMPAVHPNNVKCVLSRLPPGVLQDARPAVLTVCSVCCQDCHLVCCRMPVHTSSMANDKPNCLAC